MDPAGPASALLSLPIALSRDNAGEGLQPATAGGKYFQVILTVLTQRQREMQMPPGKRVLRKLLLSFTPVSKGRHLPGHWEASPRLPG